MEDGNLKIQEAQQNAVQRKLYPDSSNQIAENQRKKKCLGRWIQDGGTKASVP